MNPSIRFYILVGAFLIALAFTDIVEGRSRRVSSHGNHISESKEDISSGGRNSATSTASSEESLEIRHSHIAPGHRKGHPHASGSKNSYKKPRPHGRSFLSTFNMLKERGSKNDKEEEKKESEEEDKEDKGRGFGLGSLFEMAKGVLSGGVEEAGEVLNAASELTHTMHMDGVISGVKGMFSRLADKVYHKAEPAVEKASELLGVLKEKAFDVDSPDVQNKASEIFSGASAWLSSWLGGSNSTQAPSGSEDDPTTAAPPVLGRSFRNQLKP